MVDKIEQEPKEIEPNRQLWLEACHVLDMLAVMFENATVSAWLEIDQACRKHMLATSPHHWGLKIWRKTPKSTEYTG